MNRSAVQAASSAISRYRSGILSTIAASSSRVAGSVLDALGLRPADRVLAPLPLFHINPMGYGVITALLAGADVLCVRAFSASGFWPAVRHERITVLILHAPPVEILKRATGPADAERFSSPCVMPGGEAWGHAAFPGPDVRSGNFGPQKY